MSQETPIKLVAVDIDGSFLDHERKFNRERFDRVYAELKRRGIHFVVASGDQYYFLKTLFPECGDEISYVADNGAYILHENEVLFIAKMNEEDRDHVYAWLLENPQYPAIVCGPNGAYYLEGTPEDFLEVMSGYYGRMDPVKRFEDIHDQVYKYALRVPEELGEKTTKMLQGILSDGVKASLSGHGFIDLIVPGAHKGNGLKLICEREEIDPQHCVAFGDGWNDLEMLKYVGRGYVMGNAKPEFKALFDLHAPANYEEGIFEVLEKLLEMPAAEDSKLKSQA